MLNKDQFVYLLDLEVKRARRYQDFFCLLVLRIESHSDGFRDGIKPSYQGMMDLMVKEAREADPIGLLDENRLVMLLPYADIGTGIQVKSRLERILKYYTPKNKNKVMIQEICFPIDGTTTADILEKADMGEIR